MLLQAEDVKKMSFEERLRSMEMLRLSLLPEEDDDTPAWHGEILAERMEKMNNGTAQYVTLEEAFNRLGRRK